MLGTEQDYNKVAINLAKDLKKYYDPSFTYFNNVKQKEFFNYIFDCLFGKGKYCCAGWNDKPANKEVFLKMLEN